MPYEISSMCPTSEQVHAYHDGELPSAQRAAFEAHLASCRECQALLEQLGQLTKLFAQAPLAELPQRALGRMYGSFHAARARQEQSVRRLAGWMTAAAAAILVLVSIRNPTAITQRDSAPTPTGGWAELVAVMPPLEPSNGSTAELVQFAQWSASDLSIGETQ
jgi:anti-sigma factor RsiW